MNRLQRDLVALVQKVVAPMARSVRLMVGRCVLDAIDDSTKMQTLTVSLLEDEAHAGVERFQDFGFSSVPKAGAEGVFLSIMGNRSHGVVVAVDDRTCRPTGLAEGESCMHNASGYPMVHCKADGTVNLGNSPTNFVALANLVLQELTNLVTQVNTAIGLVQTHTHTTTAIDVSMAPATIFPTVTVIPTLASPGAVAAAEVKAK